MSFKTTTALAGAAFAFVGASQAQTIMEGEEATGPYGGIGYSYINVSERQFDLDENSNAVFVRLGYQFHPNFGIEADGSFGVNDGGFDAGGFSEDDQNIDIDGDDAINRVLEGEGEFGVKYLTGAYFKFTVPLLDNLNLYARSGYSYIKVNRRIDLDSAVNEDDETDFFDFDDENQLSVDASGHGYGVGGGVGYQITEMFTGRVDYMYHRFRGSDDIEAHQGMVALQYKFPVSF